MHSGIQRLLDLAPHRASSDTAGIDPADADRFVQLSEEMDRNKQLVLTPEDVALIDRYRTKLPSFPYILKNMDGDGKVGYNKVYVKQLKHAAKVAKGWKPNRGLVWMDEHPDFMSSFAPSALTAAPFAGLLTGLATKDPVKGLAGAAGGFAGSFSALYGLRKALRASGREFDSPHWPLDFGHKPAPKPSA